MSKISVTFTPEEAAAILSSSKTLESALKFQAAWVNENRSPTSEITIIIRRQRRHRMTTDAIETPEGQM